MQVSIPGYTQIILVGVPDVLKTPQKRDARLKNEIGWR